MNLYLRRQMGRRALSEFSALIATPGNLATGVKIPAPARIVVTTTSILAANTNLVNTPSRQLYAPVQAADAYHSLGRFDAGTTFTKAGGAPGTVRLYIRDDLGVLHKFAEA